MKCDFGDVNETTIHDVKRPHKRILFVPGIQKSDLNEFSEVVFSRRVGLRTRNLSSWHLKKRLWWSDVLSCRNVMRTHFLHPGHKKKPLERIRLSDVLSRRMSLRTQNQPSGGLKKRLCWSRRSDFSRFRKTIRTHFLHYGHRICDLDDVA
jgi:hypothetical protein